MPFRKKILYYGLLLLLTLLALEGMARIAYYAAYGQGYAPLTRAVVNSPAAADAPGTPRFWAISHPFYGYTNNATEHDLNAMPPGQRQADTVVIALLGGSVARDVHPYLARALRRYFAANNWPRRPVVLDLSAIGVKQPQQTITVANTLLLGGEFDLIVNLDGFNETNNGGLNYFQHRFFPFFPILWHHRAGPTAAEILLAGEIGILRREQTRLTAAAANSPWRRSALFGLLNRYRREKNEQEILRLNHRLAATWPNYALERYGPRSWLTTQEPLLQESARIWQRGSLALSRLAELAGADYYHFLQPNQYVPGAKPLSQEELKSAYNPRLYHKSMIERGYPLLRARAPDLQSQSINYFDLTGIFLDHPETLYKDECCHLNERGNELLAAEMARLMAPALRRLGAESRAAPVSALDSARRPAESELLLVSGDFQVYRGEDAKLRYVREDCAAADAEPRFFLHLTPRDPADLPPHRQEHGYDNRDFSFAEVDGIFWRGQCLAEIPLPSYPIVYLRTGQYVPYAEGELWAGEFHFPE